MRIDRIEPLIGSLKALNSVPVGVRGWVDVKLVDRQGRLVHHHQQENLILDRGLDYILSNLSAQNMLAAVAVGTGSTPPSPSQTALVNEVARTIEVLGAGPDIAYTILGDGQYRLTRVRTFDYEQANANLTEFGASESPSPVSGVRTRELFRDESGNPIVITKTPDTRLVITYNLDFNFSPTTPTNFGTITFRDLNNNPVATRIVQHNFARPNQRGTIDLSLLTEVYSDIYIYPGAHRSWLLALRTSDLNMDYTAEEPGWGSDAVAIVGEAIWSSYTNGTFYRDVGRDENPGANDIVVYGYVIARAVEGLQAASYRVRFVDGSGNADPFTKSKDYRLRFTTRFTLSRS